MEDESDAEESAAKNTTLSTVSVFAFEVAEMSISYFIPVILSAILYTKICMVLWRRNDVIHKNCNPAVDRELVMRRRVVKMLILCCAIFFVSYTPMLVLDMAM